MRYRLLLLSAAFLLSACASGAGSPPVASAPQGPAAQVDAPAVDAGAEAPPADPEREEDGGLSSAPDAWQLLDLEADGVPGVSAARAYEDLLAGRTPERHVIVAVIDGGIDTTHVDLRENLWRNEGETPGNGVDDDGNGYADDVYGWNFLGGADGRSVGHETLEVTRLQAACLAGEPSPIAQSCQDIGAAYQTESDEVLQTLQILDQIEQAYGFAIPILQAAGAGENPTKASVERVQAMRPDITQAKSVFLQLVDILPVDDVPDAREAYEGLRDYGLNLEFDPRSDIVGDDLSDGTELGYGNPDVHANDPRHGTHVAGIIGAVRDNGVGIDGIATNVRIMALRAVPDGDERDKDVANAIRYAVDNGAHIINMSFGKGYSPWKSLVDDAVRYADERGVLMVHAAGNDGEDIDQGDNFPTQVYSDGARAANWIEVGAASWQVDSLAATFSNYGSGNVDVFSPGVDILSTVPGSEYDREDGTSMAAPVVSGVAALLMAYFPDLDAAQVRRILVESSVNYGDAVVARPGDGARIPFGRLSVTGGVVNAYEAVRMALEGM